MSPLLIFKTCHICRLFFFSSSVISCVCSVFFAFLVSFLYMCLYMYASSSPSTNLSGRHLRKVAFISSALGGSFLDAFAFTVACTCVQVTCTHTHTPPTHTQARNIRTNRHSNRAAYLVHTFIRRGRPEGESVNFTGTAFFPPRSCVVFSLVLPSQSRFLTSMQI